MQLIKKMFGRAPGTSPAPGSESAQFQETDSNSESGSRNAPRRELVQVVLRDSMRRHGIPSAWIDCRILSVITRTQRTGMHVQFIVRDGIDRLLTYVPAFQTSFMEEIARFDPRVDDWLFSVSWQFLHFNAKVASLMPDPAVWAGTTAGAPLQGQVPAATGPAPLQPVAATPAPTPSPTPRPTRAPAAVAPAVAAAPPADQDVMDDLQALYAIRDAALRQGRADPAPGPAGEKDFESTHPGEDPAAPPKRW
ncbi:hypothetical protein ACFPOE_08485 [Caenimonas terrae]|uniref:Uncharacterized protein n=1 Tax=Caenimonas terrae TaxID=696074 RepID=A0ABW0NA59_9BURK